MKLGADRSINIQAKPDREFELAPFRILAQQPVLLQRPIKEFLTHPQSQHPHIPRMLERGT